MNHYISIYTGVRDDSHWDSGIIIVAESQNTTAHCEAKLQLASLRAESTSRARVCPGREGAFCVCFCGLSSALLAAEHSLVTREMLLR